MKKNFFKTISSRVAHLSGGAAALSAACGHFIARSAFAVLLIALAMVVGCDKEEKGAVAVTGVTVSPATAPLTVGETQQFTAAVAPDDADDKSVTWTTSSAAVATVSTTGLVTAAGTGTATITATANDGSGKKGTATVTVTTNAVAVTGITVSPATYLLAPGQSFTATATVTPDNASTPTYTWSSSSPTVATVADGVVSAVADGEAYIIAITTDGGFKDSVTVTVLENQNPVTGIALDPSVAPSPLYAGGTFTITANLTPTSPTISTIEWDSSNPDVATVDGGLVTAAGTGTAVITATAVGSTDPSNPRTATLEVTVSPRLVTAIEISGAATLALNESATYTVDVTPSNATDPSVTWSIVTDPEGVATIDAETGEVEAKGEGAATITATANDGSGVSDTFEVTVEAVQVTGITIRGAATLALNESATYTVDVEPGNATDPSVTWSIACDPEGVATIETTGVVEAKGEGSATITATANDDSEVSGTFTVTVSAVHVTGVSIVGESAITLTLVGESAATYQAVAIVEPANASTPTVSWSSSDEGVATVGETTGLITTVAEGGATITVTTDDGEQTATIEVTVVEPLELKAAALITALGGNASANGATVTLTGDVSATDVTVPAGITLVVPAEKTLTVTGTLTNNGTISVAGVADVTGYTGAGAVDLQSKSKSKGLVAAPANAATGWVWKFGDQQWSEVIELPDCKDATFESSTSNAYCRSYKKDDATYYYYNWAYVNTNKATLCTNGWDVPTKIDLETLKTNATGAELLEQWPVKRCWVSSNDSASSLDCIREWSQTDDSSNSSNAWAFYDDGSNTYLTGSRGKTYGFPVICVK